MKFTLEGSRYDQSTYLGRFQSSVESIDPRILLVSDDKVRHSQQLLADFKAAGVNPAETSDEDLRWPGRGQVAKHQRLLNAVCRRSLILGV